MKTTSTILFNKLPLLIMALCLSVSINAAEVEIDDAALANKIQKAFDSKELYQDALIQVASHRGFILITGQVLNAEQKDTATNTIVFASQDIRRIINELLIVDVIDNSTGDSDANLKQRVDELLRYSNEAVADKVNVVVHRSVVYLMGALTEAERNEVGMQASTVSGVASIKTAFEFVSE